MAFTFTAFEMVVSLAVSTCHNPKSFFFFLADHHSLQERESGLVGRCLEG